MCDVCSYHRHCFDFEGTTRFAWYNTILKTKKCKIGGIDAERILDVILLVFFCTKQVYCIFFQRKENGKVLYISFSGQLLNHQKITPTNGNSEIDISSTYTVVQLKHHL